MKATLLLWVLISSAQTLFAIGNGNFIFDVRLDGGSANPPNSSIGQATGSVFLIENDQNNQGQTTIAYTINYSALGSPSTGAVIESTQFPELLALSGNIGATTGTLIGVITPIS